MQQYGQNWNMFKRRWRRREVDLAVFLKYGSETNGMRGGSSWARAEGKSRRNSIDKLLACISEKKD